MDKIYKFSVDIARKVKTPAFTVNTNDLKSIKLIITITSGLVPIDLTGIAPRLAIKKPDKEVVFQDCTIADALKGLVEVTLETQAYIIPGTHSAEIMLYKGQELVSVSGTFNYNSVLGIMNNQAVESKSEFTSLTTMLNNIQATIDELKKTGTGIDAQARDQIGDLTQLKTTEKSNLTVATNELAANVSSNKQRIIEVNQKADEVTQRVDNINPRIDAIVTKMENVKFKDLPEPLYFSHRGGLLTFPEHSLEAYRSSIGIGLKLIEQDVRMLADGNLAIMHDATMDRTTDRTGPVSSFTTMGYNNATIDTLPGWNNVKPPTFEEVLNEFGNRAIYAPEIKEPAVSRAVVDMIIKHNLQEYCIVQSFTIDDLDYAIQKGITVMHLSNSAVPTDVKARGINYIGVSATATEAYIKQCIQAGLKVIVYTVNRRKDHDRLLALGVTGFFSDDPLWISRKSPTRKTDPFGEQVFGYGQQTIPKSSTTVTGGLRGDFVAPNKFGWATPNEELANDYTMQGWVGTLPATFTLTANMTFNKFADTNRTRWGGIMFCTPDDYWDDSNASGLSSGYNVLLRENGMFQLYRRDTVTAAAIAELQTTAITEGATVPLEIVVTATTITATRKDTNHSITATDSTYRNGYLHLGRRASSILFDTIKIV